METVIIPWNKIYERLNRFYHQYAYDYSDFDIRIDLKCTGCKKNISPSALLTAPVRGQFGGSLILTDSTEISAILEVLSCIDPDKWQCPQCRNSELQAQWIGSSIESYRLASLEGKYALLPPLPKGWEFVSTDSGNGMNLLSLPVSFSPTSDVLTFPGFFSLIFWDPIADKKLELKYDESNVPGESCDTVSILHSSSGEKIALIGMGFGGTNYTWVRMWRERVHLWYKTFDVSLPTVADISPDEYEIAIGTENGSVLVLSSEDGTILMQSSTQEQNEITGISFTVDGKSLITTDQCGLRLWSDGLSSSKKIIGTSISRVHKLPNGAVLLRGESTNSLWNMITGSCIRDLSSSDSSLIDWFSDVAVFPNGHFVALNFDKLNIIDIYSDITVATIDLDGQGEDAQSKAFSSGGGLIALADHDSGRKWVWRVGIPLKVNNDKI